MAMGREGDRQGDLIVTWGEMPRSPGHVFYDRLQEVLIAGGFDLFVETACKPYYAPKMGAPSTIEANAALRTIVRREDGRTYREMLRQMAKESGIDTPTADDLVRLDRARKGKKLSNEEWTSKTDPEAKIAKMKDGRTHLAYKPEHAVDLDTGVVVAAALRPADQGDTTTIEGTLTTAVRNLALVSAAPTTDKPSELVADKGYHSRALLKTLAGGAWNTRIAEPK